MISYIYKLYIQEYIWSIILLLSICTCSTCPCHWACLAMLTCTFSDATISCYGLQLPTSYLIPRSAQKIIIILIEIGEKGKMPLPVLCIQFLLVVSYYKFLFCFSFRMRVYHTRFLSMSQKSQAVFRKPWRHKHQKQRRWWRQCTNPRLCLKSEQSQDVQAQFQVAYSLNKYKLSLKLLRL